MFTIGQFAKICNISPKALRYYEKIGLLLPAKIDEGNQYRYYAKEQVDSLSKIIFLKDLDMPLKTVRSIVNDGLTREEIQLLLDRHRNKLRENVDACRAKICKLNNWDQYEEAETMEKREYCVGLRMVPAVHVRAVRKVSTDFPADIRALLLAIMQEMDEEKIVPAGAPMVIYYDEEFNPDKVDFAAAWPVSNEKFANLTCPECLAVTCTHVGPYEQLCQAYEAVFTWMNEHGYKPAGPMRDIYPNDPAVTPAEQLVTEIIAPVRK